MFKNRLISLAAFLCLLIPAVAVTDDTEIYGVSGVTVEPNVMIIMDNSGSMESGLPDVPAAYDPSVDYKNYVISGNTLYEKNAVYYYKKIVTCRNTFRGKVCNTTYEWTIITPDINNISCTSIASDLKNLGYATYTNGQGFVSETNLDCGQVTPSLLRLGNFMNYENSNYGGKFYRYQVAKMAIIKLLTEAKNKKFGLMHFKHNYNTWPVNDTDQGGYVAFECKSDDYDPDNDGEGHKQEIINSIDKMTDKSFNTNTPLAETLAEAGLYFAGKSSWYTPGFTYTSPMEYYCQKNYIILITDGYPTQDSHYSLSDFNYINGNKIGDYYIGPNDEDLDYDDSGSLTSSLLNDVAYYLFKEDLFPDTATNSKGNNIGLNPQNIITYTIGFRTEGPANDLLRLTAETCGGGAFFPASSSSGLNAALQAINSKINETNSIFLAPAVPVNRTTRTSQSDWLYLAYFRPQNTGEWFGNLKKFAIGKDGLVYGSDGSGNVDYTKPVVNDYGMIDENACSFWTTFCNDGNEVTKGGVGSILAGTEDSARKIYFYTGGTEKDLTDGSNAFTTNNASLIIPDELIVNVRKFFDTESFKWKLGAIIHSEPAIVHYSNTQSVIYVGANDGMLHCFNDIDGKELWAFIPPGQKTKIESVFTDAKHDYYVDGSPSIVYGDLITGTHHFQPKYMIFGERRGGTNYYVLDITDYNRPIWKYQISKDTLLPGSSGESLGQSWAKAKICTIATATETVAGKLIPQSATLQNVFMLAGGYATNQDLESPEPTDSEGKAIVSVQIENGVLGKFNAYDTADGVGPFMKNCIVDINTTSTYRMPDGKEITTRVYAGDLGGKVFVFADDRATVKDKDNNDKVAARVPNGDFPLRKMLFNASGKKIFYAPATSKLQNSYTEWVVFGTGDRENPMDVEVVNKIYAVKNTWLKSGLTQDNLVDLTQNLIIEGSDDDKEMTKSQIESKDGWSITFYDPGEKMISSPIVSQGFIFFTTYVPTSVAVMANDPCKSAGAAGASYLWAIELDTGAPAYDLDGDGTKEKHERRIQVATMAQPKMIGDLVSTPQTIRIPTKINFDYFFWRQR